jgi:hypothetical protein
MQDLNRLDPKELLRSGKVPSGPLFEKVLADRDRLLDELAKERADKHQLREDLEKSHQLIERMEEEAKLKGAPA